MSDKVEQTDEASRFEGESHHGWAPDIESEGDAAAEAGKKAWRTPPSGETGEGRETSQVEREGVGETEMEPGSPFGAGDSSRRGGEEIAAEEGAEPEGHKGASRRPYGKAE
ncbi:MAG: hypothetical protein QOI21_2048 [Actinomycetota bacterium]|nr:hypothetical protein [Actinomycetota bacterium]